MVVFLFLCELCVLCGLLDTDLHCSIILSVPSAEFTLSVAEWAQDRLCVPSALLRACPEPAEGAGLVVKRRRRGRPCHAPNKLRQIFLVIVHCF